MIRNIFFPDIWKVDNLVDTETSLFTTGDIDGDGKDELIILNSIDSCTIIAKGGNRYYVSLTDETLHSKFSEIETCKCIRGSLKHQIVCLSLDGTLQVTEIFGLHTGESSPVNSNTPRDRHSSCASSVDRDTSVSLQLTASVSSQNIYSNASCMKTISYSNHSDSTTAKLVVGGNGWLAVYSYDNDIRRFHLLSYHSLQTLDARPHSLDFISHSFLGVGMSSGAICVLRIIITARDWTDSDHQPNTPQSKRGTSFPFPLPLHTPSFHECTGVSPPTTSPMRTDSTREETSGEGMTGTGMSPPRRLSLMEELLDARVPPLPLPLPSSTPNPLPGSTSVSVSNEGSHRTVLLHLERAESAERPSGSGSGRLEELSLSSSSVLALQGHPTQLNHAVVKSAYNGDAIAYTHLLFAIAWFDGRLAICRVENSSENSDIHCWSVLYTFSVTDPLVHIGCIPLSMRQGNSTDRSVFLAASWNGMTYIVTVTENDARKTSEDASCPVICPLDLIYRFDLSCQLANTSPIDNTTLLKAGAVRSFCAAYLSDLRMLPSDSQSSDADSTISHDTHVRDHSHPSLLYVLTSGHAWQVTGLTKVLSATGEPFPGYALLKPSVIASARCLLSDFLNTEEIDDEVAFERVEKREALPDIVRQVLFPQVDELERELLGHDKVSDIWTLKSITMLERLVHLSPADLQVISSQIRELIDSLSPSS